MKLYYKHLIKEMSYYFLILVKKTRKIILVIIKKYLKIKKSNKYEFLIGFYVIQLNFHQALLVQ